MKVAITGACGFIPHHIIEHFLRNTDAEIIGLDMLTYASMGLNRLRDIKAFDEKRVTLIGWDISQPCPPGVYQEVKDADYILHLAAETHVDRSIDDPLPFVKTNVVGTQNVLELAKRMDRLKLMVNFSTDEVFGPAPDGVFFKEWDAFNPRNPYAASKAGAVHMCEAAHNTHKVPVCTTFTMNCFGERQHPEKYVPKCIKAALTKTRLPIHSDPTRTLPGSRCWIHCRNVGAALLFLLGKATPGDRYNIVGGERDNLWMARFIGETIGSMPQIEMVDWHTSRSGHDRRYAMSGDKLARMGFLFPVSLEESLRKTVRWTVANPKWLEVQA